MKIFPAIILFILWGAVSSAQKITTSDYKKMQASEDTMKVYSWKIITGINSIDRFKADSIFTRALVRTLKTRNSFYYVFDSIQTVSQLYAPDSSFKIFTWQMAVNDRVVRQHGAIQMRTDDGSMKLFPLIDKSGVTEKMADTIANNHGWMGAVYYKIVLTENAGRKFYTLIGFNAGGISFDRKFIEVLSFVDEQPVFGGKYFSIPNDKLVPKSPARYVMEFKKDAVPRLTWDKDLQMILMEHLVSESNQPSKKYTMVGDGDYSGFKWTNGRWIFIDRVFAGMSTPEGLPPVPVPLDKAHGISTDEYGKGTPPVEKAKPAPAERKN